MVNFKDLISVQLSAKNFKILTASAIYCLVEKDDKISLNSTVLKRKISCKVTLH